MREHVKSLPFTIALLPIGEHVAPELTPANDGCGARQIVANSVVKILNTSKRARTLNHLRNHDSRTRICYKVSVVNMGNSALSNT